MCNVHISETQKAARPGAPFLRVRSFTNAVQTLVSEKAELEGGGAGEKGAMSSSKVANPIRNTRGRQSVSYTEQASAFWRWQ